MSKAKNLLTPEEIFLQAGKLSNSLSGISKRQKREILALVASTLNLRVLPIGVSANSVGVSTNLSQRTEKPVSIKSGPLKLQRASFNKADPKWVSLQAERATIVASLKERPRDIRLVNNLRSVECEIKQLKQQLQGKSESS